jgi:hypothetical protein
MFSRRPYSVQFGGWVNGISNLLTVVSILSTVAVVPTLTAPFAMAATVTNTPPRAFHQLVVVHPAGEAVIRLSGYDVDGDKVSCIRNIGLILISHGFNLARICRIYATL